MTKHLSHTVMTLAAKYFASLEGVVSQTCAAMLRSGDYRGLASVEVDPRCYTHWETYARDCAAASLLKKYKGFPSGVDLRAAAIEKWKQGEQQCFWTNERLTRFLPEFFQNMEAPESDMRTHRFLCDVRKEVEFLIGRRPPDLLEGRFGPGATFIDRGAATTVAHKMTSEPALTRGAIFHLPQWLNTKWGEFAALRGSLSFVRGNRFASVPKTVLTDRAIAVEPSINVFYQLALGSALKARLKQRGWDLKNAQVIHRQVARESSVSREFATLDLSNASDTLSTVLVRLLLPKQWFSALEDLRSPLTQINGKWVRLEKFSSMGNGYTFELETVIFAAISTVVSRLGGHTGRLGEDVFVFGDDIIVKDNVVRALRAALEFCGFSLNEKKSFWGSTPFRESCGGDYFGGFPVRGYYLKNDLDTPERLISAANGIRAIGYRIGLFENALLKPWFFVQDQMPSGVRSCRGPEELGDLLIHDSFENWQVRLRKGRSGVRYLRVYRPVRYREVRLGQFHEDVQLATVVYGTAITRRFTLIPRDGVTGYKLGWVPFS